MPKADLQRASQRHREHEAKQERHHTNGTTRSELVEESKYLLMGATQMNGSSRLATFDRPPELPCEAA
jgi:hypothetical protein